MEFIQPLSLIGLVFICLGLVRMMNGRLKGKVSRNECHTAQEAVKDKIDTLDKNMNRRFDDLKDFIGNSK